MDTTNYVRVLRPLVQAGMPLERELNSISLPPASASTSSDLHTYFLSQYSCVRAGAEDGQEST